MKMAAEINGLLAASAGFLGAIIGAIIGGVMVYFASVKAATVQTRANYVLQIIGKYSSDYEVLCWALENKDAGKLDEARKSWFYHLLVTPLPPKIKRQFEDSLDNREWDKAEDLLRKIASGKWD
jgi:hypothetical protein